MHPIKKDEREERRSEEKTSPHPNSEGSSLSTPEKPVFRTTQSPDRKAFSERGRHTPGKLDER
ncbi:hypothetical protein F9C07_10654 [Aspergillus flavus]|uniref:Uncharacterized protein n=1 Tax=Aspergillus flavus (strain ATCC 200026 / FGSC A1120 / IAM 13836 / NRRL 3357 / JCM 12722 / SRRC 167) TaxID=332952 RepID=A0A7U2R143_ASPFN|nr:hypothetical protein F9C07_10654 [Aspergillus flavus]